jgi:Tfp pilus assembly protein PilV
VGRPDRRIQGDIHPVPAFKERGKRAYTGRCGFTLIETVISIVIVLVAVVGLFAIFATSISPFAAPQPYETTIGAQYVQEGLERVYADRRNLSRNFAFIVPGNYPSENLGAGYIRTTTIGAWPFNADTATYRQVTVQVTHNGRLVARGTSLFANYVWS